MIMMMIVMIVMMMMTCLLLLMPLSRESEEDAVGRDGSELSREELVSILNKDYTVKIVDSVDMQSFFNTTVNIETRVQKSPHKFMLTSYMKYFANFLAILPHNTSYLKIYIICISFCYFIFSKF